MFKKNHITISKLVHNILLNSGQYIDFKDSKYSVAVMFKELSHFHGSGFKTANSCHPLGIQFQIAFSAKLTLQVKIDAGYLSWLSAL